MRALAGKKPDEITCIGTSATLSDPDQEGPGQRRDGPPLRLPVLRRGRRTRSRWSGSPTSAGNGRRSAISPSPRTATAWPGWIGCWRPSPSRSMSPSIKAVVEELTGQIFEPGDDWRESLFDHLITNEYVFQSHASPQAPEAAQRSGLADLAAGGDGSAARRATGPTPNCWPIWCWGPRPRRAASRCCGPRSISSCGAWMRWSWRSDGTEADAEDDLFLSLSEAKEQSRRSARRRLLPGADLPKLRPALLREVRTRTSNSHGGRRTNSGASTTATPPRTTTGRTTPSGPPPPPRPAPGWS